MPDNWITISIETLYEARVAALVDACSSAAKATGQADRAAGLIQGVVNTVRRKVMSSPHRYRVDDDVTKVPNGLRDLTVDLIIFRLKGAIEEPLTEDERKLRGEHERTLNRIADGKDVIEMPDDPTEPPTEAGGEVETIEDGNTGSSRTDLAGL